MTAKANPELFIKSRQKWQEKRRRLARTAQPPDDARRWKARRCIWSSEEVCSSVILAPSLNALKTAEKA